MDEVYNDVNLNRQFLATDDKEEACRLLYDGYYKTVFNSVAKIMRNHPDPLVDAHDITNETFTKAFYQREEIGKPEKLLGWLLTVARNLAIDHRRAAKTRSRSLPIQSLDDLSDSEQEAPSASILAEATAEQAEANRDLIGQLFRLLPERDREIFQLRSDELSPKEIAEAINSTPGAVQKKWERLSAYLKSVAPHLDALMACLSEDDRKVMERYLDGQPLSEIVKAIGISRSTVEGTVKRVIAAWKKAAKQNPTDPVSAMANNER